MMRALLLFAIVCGPAGCASASDGTWPSLAMRAGEVQPLVQRPAALPVAATVATPADDTGLRDATARLASLERDIATLAQRRATQRDATTRATTAAVGQAADSTASAAAQVEISRSDRLASQATDLRDRLDALAGDLARQSVTGSNVAAPLRRVGEAIVRVEELRAR